MDELDRLIRDAIARRRKLRFRYDGHQRIVEPHDYGRQKGVRKVFCYQTGGTSTGALPDWRMFFVGKISNAETTDESFPGSRPVNGRHQKWDQLYASVSRPIPA